VTAAGNPYRATCRVPVMRGVAVVALAILVAGCSDAGGAGAGATTTTTTAAFTTTGPLAVTSTGLPFVNVAADTDLTVSLAADGTVHRLRMVLFDRLTLDEVFDPATQDDDGNGGGGFGGDNQDPPAAFGIAVFPVDGDPAKSGPCTDAGTGKVWDGRARPGEIHFELAAGLHDLWVWSNGPTTVAIAVSGGGDAKNHTAQAYNWTATATAPTVAKSGPAQSTSQFEETVTVGDGALVMGRFAAPDGYPDETATLDIARDGSSCGAGVTDDDGGGGSGGGGFGGTILHAAAFVGPGEVKVTGTSAAPLSPLAEGAAAVVVVAPKA
jgi:hypothetical protein